MSPSIAQLVERKTVVCASMNVQSSLGRWFKSGSKDFFLFFFSLLTCNGTGVTSVFFILKLPGLNRSSNNNFQGEQIVWEPASFILLTVFLLCMPMCTGGWQPLPQQEDGGEQQLTSNHD